MSVCSIVVCAAAETTDIPAVPEEPGVEPTQAPSAELPPDQTPEPEISPEPESTPEPTPRPKQLGQVKEVTAVLYSTHEVKVTWKKQKKAKYYRVYYAKQAKGTYRCAGVTQKQQYLVKKLKNNTRYYFYVKACRKKKASTEDSPASRKVTLKTRSYSRKTIFVGDSICQGLAGYSLPSMHIGGQKKVVAYKGLNTVTFHTRRIFRGKTGLQKLIAEKPYRIYMMLGINEIHFRRKDEMIKEYQGMVQAIRQACPQTDLVLCAISPVTLRERLKHPGYRQIPAFNKKLEKMAKKNGVKYLDYTSFLKDSGGCLRGGYAQPDGYHWRIQAYQIFSKKIQKYDLSLDR